MASAELLSDGDRDEMYTFTSSERTPLSSSALQLMSLGNASLSIEPLLVNGLNFTSSVGSALSVEAAEPVTELDDGSIPFLTRI